jgi:NAD(P)H-dependent FMN reductase
VLTERQPVMTGRHDPAAPGEHTGWAFGHSARIAQAPLVPRRQSGEAIAELDGQIWAPVAVQPNIVEQLRKESAMSKPVLAIVIGSTRPGRVGPKFATWFRSRAIDHGGFDVELVDLATLKLPFLDEPSHPRMHQYIHQHTIDWGHTVERSDAFVFVTPEYNFGYSAVLKNAIDYLSQEWADKAVGFLSYGGVAAGTRAVQQLKQVVTALKMVPVAESVNIPFFTQFIDDSGTVRPNDAMTRSADAMLDELARVTALIRPKTPVASEPEVLVGRPD